MKKPNFKKPIEYKKNSVKVVLSSRVSQKCKDSLDWASRSAGIGVSELAAGILEDYSEWLLAHYLKSAEGTAKKFE
jgi:hypothetical protein